MHEQRASKVILVVTKVGEMYTLKEILKAQASLSERAGMKKTTVGRLYIYLVGNLVLMWPMFQS